MKAFTRKVAIVVVTAVATVGFTAVSAPVAEAKDTGWGCGGGCRVAP